MRELSLNGYIDDDMYFGDEITPGSLHDMLYEPGPNQYDDVHIKLNSYGGSCNAAVRILQAEYVYSLIERKVNT